MHIPSSSSSSASSSSIGLRFHVLSNQSLPVPPLFSAAAALCSLPVFPSFLSSYLSAAYVCVCVCLCLTVCVYASRPFVQVCPQMYAYVQFVDQCVQLRFHVRAHVCMCAHVDLITYARTYACIM